MSDIIERLVVAKDVEIKRLRAEVEWLLDALKAIECHSIDHTDACRMAGKARRGEQAMKSALAIDLADALSWHHASQDVAGRAERSGYRVRALNRRWQVWATDGDFAALSATEHD
jgi:hypothetical protein